MTSLDFAAAKETLQNASASANPDAVTDLADKIIKGGYVSRFGDDVWNFYEQAFIAALDVNNRQLAETCYARLDARFPTSLRVRRLKGLQYEADGKYVEAQKVYQEILQEDETNILAAKRQIYIAKARGTTSDAIAALVKFLDIVYNDIEAWLELSDLYLQENMYPQAVFCMEELILLQPQQHLYHLKAAEILYTMEKFPLALKTYCRVVELCTDHVRGLYGIKLCTRQLLATRVSSAPPQETLEKLDQLATERLLHLYSVAYPSDQDRDAEVSRDTLLKVVRKWVENDLNNRK